MLNRYEEFVLGNTLSQWPDNKTYIEILQLIDEDNEDIVIWEPFSYYPTASLIDHIESMLESLEHSFTPKEAKIA